MPELNQEQKAELSARIENVKTELTALCKKHEIAIVPVTDIIDGRIVASIVIKDSKYVPKKEPEETKE